MRTTVGYLARSAPLSRWNPNLQHHRYWLPSQRRWISLTLTAKAMETVDRKGIETIVAELRAKGVTDSRRARSTSGQ